MGKLQQVNMRWSKRKDCSGVGADAVKSFGWVLKGRMGLVGERVEGGTEKEKTVGNREICVC